MSKESKEEHSKLLKVVRSKVKLPKKGAAKTQIGKTKVRILPAGDIYKLTTAFVLIAPQQLTLLVSRLLESTLIK